MAILYGANATKRKSSPAIMVDVAEQGGRMRVSYDSWTANAAQNDVINFGWLPIGANVYMVNLIHTAMGSSVTAGIGTSTTHDLFAAAYDCSAAGSTSILIAASEIAAAADIQIILEGANPDSGTLELAVFYTVD